MYLPAQDASSWKRCNKTAKTFRGLYHRRVVTIRLYAVIPTPPFVLFASPFLALRSRKGDFLNNAIRMNSPIIHS